MERRLCMSLFDKLGKGNRRPLPDDTSDVPEFFAEPSEKPE